MEEALLEQSVSPPMESQLLELLLTESSSVLEGGCGSGRFLVKLGSLGLSRAIGVDKSPQKVAFAQERLERTFGDDRVLQSNVRAFASRSFYEAAADAGLDCVVASIYGFSEGDPQMESRSDAPGGRTAALDTKRQRYKVVRSTSRHLQTPGYGWACRGRGAPTPCPTVGSRPLHGPPCTTLAVFLMRVDSPTKEPAG